MSFNVAAVRRQFPILSEIIDGQPVHYLDNGASAQTPDTVLDAVRAYETTGRANVLRGVHRLAERATEAYENARIEVATFLGVEPLEVVFTGGCTAAINLVAYSYGSLLKPGDRILLSELEHHSNIVPWQLLRSRTGVELDMIPVTVEGRIDLDALPRLLTPRTKLISLAHVSNVTGALLDIRAVVTLAKTIGAKVMLDGAQRAPHGPLDLPALGIDFYAFAGHKAYGPNGVGVLWARPELLEAMPPFHGGGSMIGRVTLAETTWAPPPRRFEAGTPPIGQAIGLGSGLQVDARARLDRRACARDGAGRAADGRAAEDRRHADPGTGQPAEPLSRRVLHAGRRAPARRGADPRFVRCRRARRASLLPAIDGPFRYRRHDARLDGALQRQHRHRRAADRRPARGAHLAMSDQLYQDRIVALAKAKTGAGKLAAPTKSARRDNPLCGDRVTIDVRLDDKGHIAEIAHQVRGCLLCQASASALSSIAVGRDKAGIAAIRHDAEKAIGREDGEAAEPFAAFAPVKSHKSRQECVLLPFEALQDALS